MREVVSCHGRGNAEGLRQFPAVELGIGDAACVEQVADGPDDIEIAAELVRAMATECLGVILDEEPVVQVRAVAVDRQEPAFKRVDQHRRDELRRELPRVVIVGSVGDNRVQAVGVPPSEDEIIGGGFAGGVGAARRVGAGFGEGG